jgi:transposase-like protein
MPVKYNQDTRARAIRLVAEHADEYPSEYAAITAVAGRLGMSAETLRKWIRQAAVDEGKAPGVTSSESAELPVHLGEVRRDPHAGRAGRLGRIGRGRLRLRQRSRGDDRRAVQAVTSAWVHWYNKHRLMHRLGRRPPAEAEAGYYQQAAAGQGRVA